MRFYVSTTALQGGTPASDARLLGEIADLAADLAGTWNLPPAALPAEVRGAARLDDYIGNVLNGGHAQFVGNAGAGACAILDDIVTLLESAGLAEVAAFPRKARDWVRSNPGAAAQQTGFSGGIAPALEALDVPFYTMYRAASVSSAVAAHLRKRSDLVGVADRADMHRRRSDAARDWVEGNLEIRAIIAREVTDKLRRFFADPQLVGLALAAGEGNALRLARVGITPPPPLEAGRACSVTVFVGQSGSQGGQEVCEYTFGPEGLSLTPETGAVLDAPVFISAERIARVQRLALEFRMPESVGLRWWRMGGPVILDNINLYELENWQPGKFWLRLILRRWAVKGSPEKSTFVKFSTEDKPVPEFQESLSQAALSRRAAEAGL